MDSYLIGKIRYQYLYILSFVPNACILVSSNVNMFNVACYKHGDLMMMKTKMTLDVWKQGRGCTMEQYKTDAE